MGLRGRARLRCTPTAASPPGLLGRREHGVDDMYDPVCGVDVCCRDLRVAHADRVALDADLKGVALVSGPARRAPELVAHTALLRVRAHARLNRVDGLAMSDGS
jgi:hypothetical protein